MRLKIYLIVVVAGVVAGRLWLWSSMVGQGTGPPLVARPTVAGPTLVVVQKADEASSPSALDSDTELLRIARWRVVESPSAALTWAQSQADPVLRQRLRSAVLCVWGEIDPRSAMNWAVSQPVESREADTRTVLTGAATQPSLALRIAHEMLAENSDTGAACATLLANALGANGKFSEALQFINQAPAGAMTDPVNAIFRRWVQSQPQAALEAVAVITDPHLRATAFHAAVDTWNASSPADLATYAIAMTPGADRDYAVGAAMDNWSLQDPAGLANWLNTLPRGDEYDFGIAMMIAKTDGANCPPEVAIQWVENIRDPVIRLESLLRVLQQWNQTAPGSAQQYVARATWLDEAQRQTALKYVAAVGK